MNVPVRSRRIAAATVTGAAVLSTGAVGLTPRAIADAVTPPAAQTAATAPTTPPPTGSSTSSSTTSTTSTSTTTTTQDLGTVTLPGTTTTQSRTTQTQTRTQTRSTGRAPGAGKRKPAKRGPAKPHPKKKTALPPLPPTPASIFGSPFGTGLTFPDVVSQFPIPLSLLPIYQAAGIEYWVHWEVLAAINRVETNFGQDLSVSSAGAEGWMQFLPSSWAQYGMDADGDGHKNPYDPVDAIFAAAHYLQIAGAAHDLRGAIFAYNHSTAYVDSVLGFARQIASVPVPLIGALSGVNQGLFPVHAPASYLDTAGTQATAVQSTLTAQAGAFTDISAPAHAAAVASEAGRVVKIGYSAALGHYIELRDAYGTTYTYGHLGSVARWFPAPQSASTEAALGGTSGRSVGGPAALTQSVILARALRSAPRVGPSYAPSGHATGAPVAGAAPARSLMVENLHAAAASPGGLHAALASLSPLPQATVTLRGGASTRPLVIAPSVLRSIARAQTRRPPVSTAPKLLASQPRRTSTSSWVGLAPQALAQRVLSDHRISIYACGRADIGSGQIDARVLATLEFLADSGLDPTVTALKCGHSLYTESGNISEHSTGDAVDIGAINGIPIVGHQGPGSITDVTIRRLLLLTGAMKPHQIISLMTFPGTDNTLALPSHDNHIHVGFRPASAFGNPLDVGGLAGGLGSAAPAANTGTVTRYAPTAASLLALPPAEARWQRLQVGSLVLAGTVLGRLGDATNGQAPQLRFTIQPASAAAPLIDPSPVLDGWRLRERTPLYRGHTAHPSIGQALLMDPAALARLVLADRRISIYRCGRADVASGQIDARVLGTLELLADAGLHPVVSRLACGHPSGSVGAAYAAGDAVDISAFGPTAVRGHQGAGSVTVTAIRRLLALQGWMKPTRIVSLLSFPDADNTVAAQDHAGRVEIDFAPLFGANLGLAERANAVLQPGGTLGAGTAAGGSAAGPATTSVRAPSGVPATVAKMFSAGNAIATLPYVWGGGHASFQDTGYDCSGSVSYMLAAAGLLQAPLVSGEFENWGDPGPGRWVTIYANGDHVFLTVAGWRFDTVALAETGSRWSRQPASGAGFVVRHPPGL